MRRHGKTASSTGSASSTSGCTHTAAPASQPARPARPRLCASTAYSSSPTATASSGCPQRAETDHKIPASAAASSPRFRQVTPSRSASASAANSAHAAQRDLVRPGHQPHRRVQVERPGNGQRQAQRRDDERGRHQDDRRPRQRDQPGPGRVDPADVPVRHPGRRHQRAPQVVGQPPLLLPHQRGSPGGGEHPHQHQPSRRDQRQHPPRTPAGPHGPRDAPRRPRPAPRGGPSAR